LNPPFGLLNLKGHKNYIENCYNTNVSERMRMSERREGEGEKENKNKWLNEDERDLIDDFELRADSINLMNDILNALDIMLTEPLNNQLFD
jgi:hypothetical protein